MEIHVKKKEEKEKEIQTGKTLEEDTSGERDLQLSLFPPEPTTRTINFVNYIFYKFKQLVNGSCCWGPEQGICVLCPAARTSYLRGGGHVHLYLVL